MVTPDPFSADTFYRFRRLFLRVFLRWPSSTSAGLSKQRRPVVKVPGRSDPHLVLASASTGVT